MIETVLQSLATTLKNKYNCRIYVDELPQGMQDGDIFILPIEVPREHLRGNLWRNTYDLDIHLFERKRMQGLKKGEEVKRLVEWITYKEDGKPIHGTNISSTYIDGVMHIFVTYVLDETIKGTAPDMAGLEYTGELKHGRE